MRVEYWYRQFCAKYQDVLKITFRHRWQTGQFWGTTCPCDACNNLNMYHDEVYRLERLKQGQTFAVVWDVVGHFNIFNEERDVVWIPSWWDIQKAIYDYGFRLTREEHWASTLYEALFVFATKIYNSDKYKFDKETTNKLKAMIEELKAKIEEEKETSERPARI